MRIEDLKWWMWAIIGLIAGLGLSYAWTSVEPPDNGKSTRSIQFQQHLHQAPLKTGEPPVSNIRVFPPIQMEDDENDGKMKTVYPVTFYVRTETRDRKGWTWELWRFNADTPFIAPAQYGRPAGWNDKGTIRDYLNETAKTIPHAKYTFVWWQTPKWTYAIFTGGSVLVIGVLWPMLLTLLSGGSLRRAKVEDDYDLSRFKGEPEAVKLKSEIPDSEEQKLADLEASLEASLKASGTKITAPTEVMVDEDEVRDLKAVPAADSKPLVNEPKPGDVEYRGEFYPTARKKAD